MGADLSNIIKTQKLTDEHVQFLVYQLLRGLKVLCPLYYFLLVGNAIVYTGWQCWRYCVKTQILAVLHASICRGDAACEMERLLSVYVASE